MKRFVMRQNIEHYRALLDVTTDPSQRRSIEQLLHDEEAKLKKYDDDNKKNCRLQQDGLINHALIAPAAWRCWPRSGAPSDSGSDSLSRLLPAAPEQT